MGEYAVSVKGKKPKHVSKIQTSEFSIPYVNIKAFEQGEIDEYTDGAGCVICEDGDFLMVWDGSRSGYVGKAIKGALGSTLVKLTFPGIENNYAYYFLQSKYLEINTRAKGVGIPHVDPNLVWNYEFRIPPLPEQQRIVARIEELFSELDKGVESLKTAQQQLKVYRQAVLKYAFEGNFTEEWRRQQAATKQPKMAMAAEPVVEYKTTQQNDDQLGVLPEGWKWCRSGELFTFVTSGSRGWAKYYSNQGSIFIRITNLNFDTLNLDLSPESIQHVCPPNNAEGLRTKVLEGDFLFSITGYLGMFAIAPKMESAFVNQHVCLCRPKNNFNKEYVGYWIISKSGGYYFLNKNQKGAVKAGLSLEDVKSFPIPITSIDEQQQIVYEIERRLSVCDKIEESIVQGLKQTEALRQSILKRAFEGKLVPQDPNEKLLERIKAAKENGKPENKEKVKASKRKR